MSPKWTVLPLGAALFAGACAYIPTGPNVLVLPGSGKPFEQFQVDDMVCRQWALQQSGVQPGEAGSRAGVGTAVAGTLIGAGLGAAIGAAAGSPATGAAVGAGGGLLGGSLMGADTAYASSSAVQRRYDNAYLQCMYAKGNQIPGRAAPASQPAYRPVPPPPPPSSAVPPPPPGVTSPVPPPPGAYPPPPPPPPR